MSLQKFGVAQKIKTVVSSESEFEALRNEIVNTNNLVRCTKCGKLLAKMNNDMISVKRKDIDFIAKASYVSIKCPVCSTTNGVVPE
jgi:phage FluMu protein Com